MKYIYLCIICYLTSSLLPSLWSEATSLFSCVATSRHKGTLHQAAHCIILINI